ncbi:alginate lyase family protein [Polaribacter haliotis]|uniref:Alginate lyase family protein n=1 Tax=Polaribacter haliotis TaxID=1888915 RepID=A0A7L8AG60_9FLAO|nr:alginate lyase family protein [Polaribacter haliotis]QOD60940.1 alginate lyase family protein [Polaribacter haliotis]
MKKTLFFAVFITILFNCKKENKFNLIEVEKERVLKNAEQYLTSKPITVTANIAERSSGNKHDFYSEGDYWWPNPNDLEGSYIRKDGLTNPDNFTAHRKAMIRLCEIAGSLGSAYIITKDEKYVEALMPHLKAWYVNEETKMNPNLLFAQAIKGKVTGRGIGIIDTLHLIEVALAIKAIENSTTINTNDLKAVKKWFSDYLSWLTTHKFGEKERNNGNNHSTCWALQVATFADLVNDKTELENCRNFYENTLLPNQMALDGSFPKETARTKPYGYSLFNLDAMVSLCQVLSTENENLFNYKTKEGKNIQLGMEFLYPFIKNKKDWPFQKDVMYWNNWPIKQASLLFVGLNSNEEKYLDLWEDLSYDSTPEIVRNTIVKNPVLWGFK